MQDILIASHEYSNHLATLVSQMGYKAEVVTEGSAALAHLRTTTPSLIIADTRLADISGGSLAYRAKHVSRLKHVPFLLLVNTYDAKGRADAESSFADGIILKPFSASFIKETLRYHLCNSVLLNSSPAYATSLQYQQVPV